MVAAPVENISHGSRLGELPSRTDSLRELPNPSQPGNSSAVEDRSPSDPSSTEAPDVTYWTRLDRPPQLIRRRFQRMSVEATRSLSLQLLSADWEPCSALCSADILDISLGGVCLLVLQDFPLPQGEAPRLRLNLSAQPGFGIDCLDGQIRWFVQSGLVLTLGVGFEKPLEQLPSLLRCRRATPRDLEPQT